MLSPQLRSERGTVFVLIALSMPVMLLLVALTLDVGNWYITKHKFQNRADRGALAAALAYGSFYPECVRDPDLGTMIANEARRFAGDDRVGLSIYNALPEDAAAVIVNGIDDPSLGDPDAANPCAPQDAGIESPSSAATNVVVETSVPSLMGDFGAPTDVYARSRASVLQISSMSGYRPFAVADQLLPADGYHPSAQGPDGFGLRQCVWVQFADGEYHLLTRPDPVDDPFLYRATVHGLSTMGPDTGTSLRVSAVIGPGSQGCSSPGPEAVTYPNVGYVISWNSSGRPRPWIRIVQITGGCPTNNNPGFVPRTYEGTNPCQIDARVRVCFDNPDDPVVRFDGDVMLNEHGLPWEPDPPGNQGPPECQDLSGSASVTPGQGGDDGAVGLHFVATNNRRSVPLTTYVVSAGNDLAVGPIADFRLSVISNSTDPSDNPFPETVEIRLDPGTLLTFQGTDTTPFVLRGQRVAGGTSAPIACPGPGDPLVDGCVPIIELADPCTASDPLCAVNPTAALTIDYDDLWAPGGTCTDNNWDYYPATQHPDNPAVVGIPPGDPRLIVLPVVASGSEFDGPRVGVRYFAAFYVTGWDDADSDCSGENEVINRTYPAVTGHRDRTVWGHFIKFVVPPSNGSPAMEACEPEFETGRVRACIATVVR